VTEIVSPGRNRARTAPSAGSGGIGRIYESRSYERSRLPGWGDGFVNRPRYGLTCSARRGSFQPGRTKWQVYPSG
jgi:hypothetical protein